MNTYFYISFATKTDFLGATVIRARNETAALMEANRKKLNPGGEAAIIKVPRAALDGYDRVELLSYVDRLVGKDELTSNGARRLADLRADIREAIEANAVRVCEKHNGGR